MKLPRAPAVIFYSESNKKTKTEVRKVEEDCGYFIQWN